MTKIDRIFSKKMESVSSFDFNSEVAEVFDDMIIRSIPCYMELQNMIMKFIIEFYDQNTNIYDLGCSTGNTIFQILNSLPDGLSKNDLSIKAIDKSEDMLRIAREKCRNSNVQWICDSIEKISIENASVVISNYTLQFVKPENRLSILKRIYSGLNKNGILILSEKISASDEKIDGIIKEFYYDFKLKNEYSRLEIEQKDESLKNVLIPMKFEKYYEMLQQCGFKKINIIFKYYNFMSLIAVK